ncbi:MAG: MtnX-like HAD-IB family phosphatase [Clostridiaceae bacterium]|nr:MtnX-like HAD-IB family phosphatase [Clostridiaceae bacterium]
MEKVNYIFFVDFDGTITKQDVCEAIVTSLAGDGWEEINEKWETRQLSTVECARQTFKTFKKKSPASIKEIVDTMELEEGFKEFVAYCRENHYPIYILSDGYDYYIDYILESAKLSLPVYSNKLIFTPDIDIEAPHQSTNCDLCGVCKTEILSKLKQPNQQSVYIGDGTSDFCAAKETDHVFARRKLYHHCISTGINAYKFDDFYDIMEKFKNMKK